MLCVESNLIRQAKIRPQLKKTLTSKQINSFRLQLIPQHYRQSQTSLTSIKSNKICTGHF